MEAYFVNGAGSDAFGAQQEIAVSAVRRMLQLAEETALALYADHEAFLRRKAQVEEFARAHPIDGTFSSRESALTELARFSQPESAGALAAVGQATETLADVSLRLNAYVALLPKVARWQAALAAEDVTGRENLSATLDDVRAVGAAARRADGLLADLSGTLREASGPLRELIDQQRAELLAAVERERVAVTGFITAEREATLAAVGEERRAAMASVGEERAAALAGLDALAKRSIEDASGRARGMANDVFWRALVLIAASALLFAVAYRLARGR
jgi:hypothetical protein